MRPISPYLSVYKPQIGSLISIFARITGVFLIFYLVIYLILLYLVNSLLSFYTAYNIFFLFFFGNDLLITSLLLFFTCNIFYHIFFSVRYLYWSFSGGIDNRLPLNLESNNNIAIFLLISLLVSIFSWFILL